MTALVIFYAVSLPIQRGIPCNGGADNGHRRESLPGTEMLLDPIQAPIGDPKLHDFAFIPQNVTVRISSTHS
jgi:hypothetical protein